MSKRKFSTGDRVVTDDYVICTIRSYEAEGYYVVYQPSGKYNAYLNYRWTPQENGTFIAHKATRQLTLIESAYSDGLDNWV